ncbi:MAG: hypothetical protein ROO70_05890 [Labrenzia sp.]
MNPKPILLIVWTSLISLGLFYYYFIREKTNPINLNAYTTQLDVYSKYHAFAHQFGTYDYGIVLFDTSAGSISIFRAEGKVAQAPHFSRDGQFLYYAETPLSHRIERLSELKQEQMTSTLKKCSVHNGQCESLLRFTGEISSIAELSDGSILFAGGVPEVRADPFSPDVTFLGFRRYDFYLAVTSTNIERLSSFEAHTLTSASVAGNTLVFQVFLNSDFREKYGRHDSEIYRAELMNGTAGHQLVFYPEEPFLTYGDRFDLGPDIAPDGKHLVFQSARSGKGGYIYDFVVAELPSNAVTNVIVTSQKANANAVSRAVFSDNQTLNYMSHGQQSYQFWSRKIDGETTNLVAELSFGDLKQAFVE